MIFGLEVAAKPLHAQGVGPPLYRGLAEGEAVLLDELARELPHREPPPFHFACTAIRLYKGG